MKKYLPIALLLLSIVCLNVFTVASIKWIVTDQTILRSENLHRECIPLTAKKILGDKFEHGKSYRYCTKVEYHYSRSTFPILDKVITDTINVLIE